MVTDIEKLDLEVQLVAVNDGFLYPYKDMVAACASFCFILQMLSPIPTCYKFIRTQSVGEMSALPYITAYLSCFLWLIYGFVIGDIAISHPNIIGSLLQFCYVVCFYIYCTCKTKVKRQMIGANLLIVAGYAYTQLEQDHATMVYRLGLVTCAITIVFFASPFATLRHVLKAWNTESLPTLLILFTFIVSIQWWLYGVIIDNMFVQVPNIIGTILPGIQLLLILFLPRHSTKHGKHLPT